MFLLRSGVICVATTIWCDVCCYHDLILYALCIVYFQADLGALHSPRLKALITKLLLHLARSFGHASNPGEDPASKMSVLLHLLVLSSDSYPVDVDRNWDNNLGLLTARVTLVRPNPVTCDPRMKVAGLDPLPFGPPVLKPYLDLIRKQG